MMSGKSSQNVVITKRLVYMTIALITVSLTAISDVIFSTLTKKLPKLSPMFSKIINCSNITNIFLFDMKSQLFITKDTQPVNDGKLIRRVLFIS